MFRLSSSSVVLQSRCCRSMKKTASASTFAASFGTASSTNPTTQGRVAVCAAVARRTIQPSSASCYYFSTTADQPKYYYGRVKLFLRSKAYGFIVKDHDMNNADDDNDAVASNSNQTNNNKNTSSSSSSSSTSSDIFVHRNGIYGADLHPMADLFLPFLVKGERVRFELKVDPSRHDASEQAVNVVYEDGSPIPYYRLGYVQNITNYEYRALGETVHQIITNAAAATATASTTSDTTTALTGDDKNNNDNNNDDDTLALIQKAVKSCESSIAAAQERYDTQLSPPSLTAAVPGKEEQEQKKSPSFFDS